MQLNTTQYNSIQLNISQYKSVQLIVIVTDISLSNLCLASNSQPNQTGQQKPNTFLGCATKYQTALMLVSNQLPAGQPRIKGA